MATTITTANHIQSDDDFVTDSVAELPHMLQSKENLVKLVEWYAERWQTLDEKVIDLGNMRLLDNAEGEVLTMLAERLGVERYDQTDIELRALLKLRAYRQTVGDTRDDIVSLIEILFYGDTPIISKRSHNFVEVVMPENCLSNADAAQQIDDMFPINTNLWVTQADEDPFYFVDTKTDEQPDDTGGFSDSKEDDVESYLTEWVSASTRSIKNT